MLHHYTECGLENVYIEGVEYGTDEDGNRTIKYPPVNRLHKAIANEIINAPGLLRGREIRFLRTEMGMTQADLARFLHRNGQSVARWEKGEVAVDAAQDVLIRQLAVERIGLWVGKSVEVLSRERLDPNDNTRITIRKTADHMRHRSAASV